MKTKLFKIFLATALLVPGTIQPIDIHAAELSVLDFRYSPDRGDLAIDGYHWDATSKTLTLNPAVNLEDKKFVLPGDDRLEGGLTPDVRVVTSSNGQAKIGGIEIGTDENGKDFATLVFDGQGSVFVSNMIEEQGVNIRVTKGTELQLPNGASLQSNFSPDLPSEGKFIVEGTLTAGPVSRFDPDFPADPAIKCSAFKIGSQGSASILGENGIKINDEHKSFETDTIEENKLEVEKGGFLFTQNSMAGIWISDEYNDLPGDEATQKKDIKKHFIFPENFLNPNDYEIIGLQDISQTGSAYIIVDKNAPTKPTLEYTSISNAQLNLNLGFSILNPIPAKRHEEAGSDISIETNLNPNWINNVKVNGVSLTKDTDYAVVNQIVVIKADFLETLYKTDSADLKQTIVLEYQNPNNTVAAGSLQTSFDIEKHTFKDKHDETQHWEECECGEKRKIEAHTFVQKHDGNTHWEECSVCGQKRNEAKHTFVPKYDKKNHWEECSVCGEKRNELPHIFGAGWKKDDTNHWHECVCGAKSDQANHTFVLKYYKNIHWEECSVCGEKRNEANHTFKPNHDKTYHWEECACGAIRNRRFHTFVPKHDETYHWDECECGHKADVENHTYEWIIDKEATESAAGSKHQECSVCHHKLKPVEIPKLEHKHVFGTDWKTDATLHWHECKCGEKADVKEHTFKEVIDKKPTCTQPGLKHQECTICKYKTPSVEIAPLEHDYVNKKDDTYHWQQCSKCGDIINKEKHTFEWIIDQEATESAAGSKHQECNVCHHKLDPVEIPKLEHKHVFGTDWKQDATSHWHECACGEKADVANHTYEWIIDKEATESAVGSKHQECNVCHHKLAPEVIPVLPPAHTHEFSKDWQHNDESHWHECNCGEKADVANHTYEWIIDKEPTEASAGAKHQECNVCHHALASVEIPKLEHKHVFGTDWKQDETSHWHECACGEKADVAAHTYEWIIDKEATSTEAGSKHQECSVCHHALEAVEIKPVHMIYKVIYGGGQIYNLKKTEGPMFKINGPVERFKNIYIDGVLVDPKGYEVSESTTIQFTKAYINTLKVGKHTFQAEYTDGKADTTFTIVKDGDVPTGVITGTSTWLMSAGISAILASVVSYKRKNRK